MIDGMQNSDNPLDEAVKRARDFAVAAHGDQKYGGDEPYAVHLDAVVTILAPFGAEAQIAGYLHDVVEDTSTPLEAIRQSFGDRVADCVASVTDESGANRRERKAKTNAKLAALTDDGALALVVKAADRLANLRASVTCGSASKLDMYRREHPAFRQAAYRAGLCDALWQEIDAIIAHRTA
jgi:(p)ppGpp synthase/HD superfamily hydrolase